MEICVTIAEKGFCGNWIVAYSIKTGQSAADCPVIYKQIPELRMSVTQADRRNATISFEVSCV